MRRVVPVALVWVAFTLPVPAVGAQTADEIVAKNLQAKGGIEKLRDTNTIRATGTVTMQGRSVPMVSLSKRPNLTRREMEVSGQKMVQGFDGTTLWMSMTGRPAQEMPPGPQSDGLKRAAAFDPIFLDWEKKGHKIEYRGKLTEGGKEMHRLVVTQKDGPPMDYYFDAATHLEVRTVMQSDDPGAKGQMETRFSDYREIDGRIIPFVMTNLLNGRQVAQMRLDKVEFNVPLDDALFRMPK